MAVLRKKLDIKPSLPDHITNGLTRWIALQNSVCDMLSNLTGRDFDAGHAEIRAGELKGLRSAMPENGLHYGYGIKNAATNFVMSFDADFAKQITGHALAKKSHDTDKAYEPSLLDLILFKPVMEAVSAELCLMFGEAKANACSGLQNTQRTLKAQEIELPKDIALWNEVTLFIKALADEGEKTAPPSKSKTDKKTPKSSKKTDTKTEKSKDASLPITIILPQEMVQRLCTSHGANDQAPLIDLENPWTRHMRDSLDTGTVPVRAVVEKCRMTVADCTRLEIGQIIELPGVSLQTIGLETNMNGKSVNFGAAALGIYKSNRAVKLISDMNTDFYPNNLIL